MSVPLTPNTHAAIVDNYTTTLQAIKTIYFYVALSWSLIHGFPKSINCVASKVHVRDVCSQPIEETAIGFDAFRSLAMIVKLIETRESGLCVVSHPLSFDQGFKRNIKLSLFFSGWLA